MLQFSTRGLALYILFVDLTLALTRVDLFLGGIILAVAIVAANFFVPVRVWRFVTYGALVGILAGIIVLVKVADLRHDAPVGRRHGPGEIVVKGRSYAFHLGALVGGTVGLLILRGLERRDETPADQDRKDV